MGKWNRLHEMSKRRMQRDVRVGEEKVGLGRGQAKEASGADEQQEQGGR